MESMVQRNNLELSVRDFGPIARAEIDLRPLTVFVGPSNTGKSYLAILIYALHRFLFDYRYSHGKWLAVHSGAFGSLPAPKVLYDEYIGELIEWIDAESSIVEEGRILPGGAFIRAPESIETLIRPLLRDLGTYRDVLKEEIAQCFGVADAGRLIRYKSGGPAIVSLCRRVLNQSRRLGPFDYKFVMKRTGSEVSASVPDDLPLYFQSMSVERLQYLKQLALELGLFLKQSKSIEYAEFEQRDLITCLAELAQSYLYDPLDKPAHYLPADRTGVMHAHRIAVGSLIRRASYSGFRSAQSLPIISGVLADFLRQLGELDVRRPYSWLADIEDSSDLAKQVEWEMLKGTVNYEASLTGYPVFSYRPDEWKEDIPLMNTSSMVSELAPVVLYLRHLVRPGETLIIEEPESHLHPAMQVEFTRQLAAVVRAGVRVIITTHSEWVLDELANLVRVSGLPESRREGIGGADYALTPEQLGVWLFEPKRRPRGSVVKEIPFDEDFGGFRSGFDEVSIGTYNDYAAISNRLERSGA